MKMRVRIEARSSSILARYLLSPVSFRSFLASLVRRTDERVSFMPTTTKTNKPAVTLAAMQIKFIRYELRIVADKHDVNAYMT